MLVAGSVEYGASGNGDNVGIRCSLVCCRLLSPERHV